MVPVEGWSGAESPIRLRIVRTNSVFNRTQTFPIRASKRPFHPTGHHGRPNWTSRGAVTVRRTRPPRTRHASRSEESRRSSSRPEVLGRTATTSRPRAHVPPEATAGMRLLFLYDRVYPMPSCHHTSPASSIRKPITEKSPGGSTTISERTMIPHSMSSGRTSRSWPTRRRSGCSSRSTSATT